MVCGILFLKIVQNSCHILKFKILKKNGRKLGCIFQWKYSQIKDIFKKRPRDGKPLKMKIDIFH